MRNWCLEYMARLEAAEKLVNSGLQPEHPLVKAPLARARVIKQLAGRENHPIGMQPCESCQAWANG